MRLKCGSVRCGWCWPTNATTHLDRQRSYRSRPRSGVRRGRCMSGSRRPRSIAVDVSACRDRGRGTADPKGGVANALERENRELRQANESCAKHRHILLRRSEPKSCGARSSDDRVHRRSACRSWGRADLQGPAAISPLAPRQPTMHTRRNAVIRCACRRGRAATLDFGSSYGACSMPTTASTVCGRSGGSCSARGSTSRAARLHGLCG
jgi:hypothetical protein